MEVFDAYKRNSEKVADFLKDLAKFADRKPNHDQVALNFGDDVESYRKEKYLQIPSENPFTEAEEKISDSDLPKGYRTESGRNLDEADSQEFILKPNGSKNFGRIDDEIAYIANQTMAEDNSDFRFKAAPIRLQVGMKDIIREDA